MSQETIRNLKLGVKFEIFATAYIIGGPLVTYQIGLVSDSCPRRKYQKYFDRFFLILLKLKFIKTRL